MPTVQKRGDHYRVLVRRKGHKTQTKTFKRKIDADRWARQVESAMDAAVFVEPIKELTSRLFDRYAREVSPTKRGARWEALRIAVLQRSATFMDKPLGDLVGADIQAWRDKRLQAVSAATVNREMNLMSGVFTHAIKEWHYRMVNPVRAVKRPPKAKPRNRRVAPWELEALWGKAGRAAPRTTRSYVPWAFEFAVETGMRVGELCRLRWSDVHADECWLHVEPGKNGDARDVPLSARAVELLGALPKGEGVFPVNAGSLGVEFRRACKALGIKDLHFHDARHEATSRLAKKLSVMELAAVIGHRDLKSLMVYYNPTARELASKLGASQSSLPHP